MEKRLFEIVSKNEGMISVDLWFDDDMEYNGENFPLEYIEFSDFNTKK